MRKISTRTNNDRTHCRQDRHSFQRRGSRHTAVPDTAELVLIRGLPGSGKSTLAIELAEKGYAHFEADMFFIQDGVYLYDAGQIRDAHNWCKALTLSALSRGERVVVANTFTRLTEMRPYLDMCPTVRIMEAKGCWPNKHGVSPEHIQEMAERWEALPNVK
ncbi:AAA family ATPase [Alcaligenaceae bacterium]|nr:AAA family ATPase [Alcaligenaceae bacterium]